MLENLQNRFHCIALSLKDSRKEIQSYKKQYNNGKKLQKESLLTFGEIDFSFWLNWRQILNNVNMNRLKNVAIFSEILWTGLWTSATILEIVRKIRCKSFRSSEFRIYNKLKNRFYGCFFFYPPGITKSKPFTNEYNWKEINFPSEKDWKKIEKYNVTVALNVLYVKKEKIYLAYVLKQDKLWKTSYSYNDSEGWHCLAVRNYQCY